jgi:hypothetical protein
MGRVVVDTAGEVESLVDVEDVEYCRQEGGCFEAEGTLGSGKTRRSPPSISIIMLVATGASTLSTSMDILVFMERNDDDEVVVDVDEERWGGLR